MTDGINPLLVAVSRATFLKEYVFGGQYDPVYPYHGAIRTCPFCGDTYRVHGGFADHRDCCEEGPNPGANPAGPVDGGESV